MKKINKENLIENIKTSCQRACCVLSEDVINQYKCAKEEESSLLGKEVLSQIIINAKIGKESCSPVCQDTGMVVCFVEIGELLNIDFNLTDAINEGVRRGYKEGFLRKSIVSDPINRINTNDNTPAVIYYDFVKGDKLTIDIMPKGFGSENMSRIAMLKPSDGIKGIKDFVIETVRIAGPNPCPPIYVGVGIGGTMDKAAVISKKALLRKPNSPNIKESLTILERELKTQINKLNIGPAGYKGDTTAFDVFIEEYPTHIAGLPVAVTICCHSYRHGRVVL